LGCIDRHESIQRKDGFRKSGKAFIYRKRTEDGDEDQKNDVQRKREKMFKRTAASTVAPGDSMTSPSDKTKPRKKAWGKKNKKARA